MMIGVSESVLDQMFEGLGSGPTAIVNYFHWLGKPSNLSQG